MISAILRLILLIPPTIIEALMKYTSSCLFLSVLMSCLLGSASARADSAFEGEEFNENALVADEELATLRGGFIGINGVLIDFSFINRVSINNVVQNSVSVSTASALVAENIGALQALGAPNIIQNTQNDAVINVHNQIDMQVTGAMALASRNAQFNQMAYQNMMAQR